MEVIIESSTVQVFQGERYYKCGPYFQKKGRRLHRVVWESLNGAIPKGWHIHHVDHDTTNNQPGNLALVSKAEHLKHHANTPEALAAARERWSANVQSRAKEWHRSPEGRAWHREHGLRVAAAAKTRVATCEECTQSFETKCTRLTVRFCSQVCGERSRARRAGIPRITDLPEHVLTCAICGVEFSTKIRNKKTTVCRDTKCRNRSQHMRRLSLKSRQRGAETSTI